MSQPARTVVCFVNPFQHGGGAEYQIDCLIREMLALQRYDIYYLARHVHEAVAPVGFKVIRIGRSGNVPRFGYMTDAVPLYRALGRLQPTVIYQRVACGYTGISAAYAHRHSQTTRMIWHVAHDTDVMPGSEIYGRNPVRRALEKCSVEYGIRHTRHIVTQTRHQADLLLQNYGRRADAVVPNFHPTPPEPSNKPAGITVMWIANLKRWKQPEVFVRLAQRLRDLPQVRFVMVGAPASGGGDEAWSDELERSMRDTPNLTYLGQRTQDEVNDLLSQAHVFVNTSQQEGFPNTFIQAWMRRVPVVSLTVNPDQVLDGERTGIHAGTEETLATAVRLLVTDEARRESIAGRARDYAIAQHSTANIATLIDLIDGRSLAGR